MLSKASWWGKFSKKVTGWLFDDCGIASKKKEKLRISLSWSNF